MTQFWSHTDYDDDRVDFWLDDTRLSFSVCSGKAESVELEELMFWLLDCVKSQDENGDACLLNSRARFEYRGEAGGVRVYGGDGGLVILYVAPFNEMLVWLKEEIEARGETT